MAPELPPFDEKAVCPKCGGETIATNYEADAHGYSCRMYSSGQKCGLPDELRREPKCCKAEHLHRGCKRCHYLWAEAVRA